jgi:hypothetical protein
MSLRIRASEVVVVAEPGRFTGRVDLTDGVNFIRAENSMGKTTVLMSALYALGLEGMLGPGTQAPLKPVVQTEIQDESGVEHPVIESWVMTEFENGEGERLTLRRPIAGGDADTRLVMAWNGGALTDPGSAHPRNDYFVRMEGAARREAGLHHRLANFIDWDLPDVARWDGSSVPLYMEILAPMFFVEQTRGWSGIASVMPRYLRVRDPDRRAVEFLMGLSGLTRAQERETVSAALADLRADWRANVEAFSTRVEEVAGRHEGLPKDPPADWPPRPPVVVRVLLDDEWVALNDALSRLRAQLEVASQELPIVEQVANQTAQELHSAEQRLARLAAQLAAASRDLAEQRAEFEALSTRIRAIEEDRQRYADAIRLASLGSVEPLAVSDARCPTCDQSLPHTLLGDHARPVMTLEENKQLLDEERQTFMAMHADAERVLVASRQRAVALRREIDDARSDVRALKATLTQNAKAPSRAIIERQVRLAQRIEQLEAIADVLVELDETLTPMAMESRRLQAELRRLSGEQPSDEDRARLSALATSMRDQLREYSFSSVPPDEVEIAPDNYMPFRAGEPILPKDLSASDNVRLIWAYLIALLEIGREFQTPHPGVVVFDEPGQQEVSDESLQALFGRLADTGVHNQQAIVATSKERDQLTFLLGDIPATRNDYDGHILQLRGGGGPGGA